MLRIRPTSALLVALLGLTAVVMSNEVGRSDEEWWSLRPIERPVVPGVATEGAVHPIDAFLARAQQEASIVPFEQADKLQLLRRITFDLIGLPPTPEQQSSFLADTSDAAYDTLVDQLLDDPQHGVRYGRHWLDVLCYTDIDRGPTGGGTLYLWRDWVIRALNEDIPYDAFVCAQLTGHRSLELEVVSPSGHRGLPPQRPDDEFALGLLARGATGGEAADHSLAFHAVTTVSSAFLGMTVSCAKCHDHFYDAISQEDFYATKALFDPLVVRRVSLASAEERFANGRAMAAFQHAKTDIERQIEAITREYHRSLYDQRVELLPPNVQKVIRKPSEERTDDEQRIADEYYPVLRIDPSKLRRAMPAELVEKYDGLRQRLRELDQPPELPEFWSVEEEEIRRRAPAYVLTSGNPDRPETDRQVEPGVPLAGVGKASFRQGRREGFVSWLVGRSNPLFARVAVNRIWQWHFGSGLHERPSDFGLLGGTPDRVHRDLLDWLASQFVEHDYSMKWLHRTIVTSEAYRRASVADPSLAAANEAIDPRNRLYWKAQVRRLEAESIWDAIHSVAARLDDTIGGPSFRQENAEVNESGHVRRGIYLRRGFHVTEEKTAEFLRVFDVEDGRTPCPVRNTSVTAPQSLLLFNSPLLERAAESFAQRVTREAGEDDAAVVDLAYRIALGRRPSDSELAMSLDYLRRDDASRKEFCWMLYNLDEFIYVP